MIQEGLRAPQQARSQLTLERILSSSTALIAEKSYDDMSIAEIAHKAGISVGAFYSRFSDKEALFLKLQRRLGEETRERIASALSRDWSKTSLRGLLQHVVRNNAELYNKYRGVLTTVHVRTRVLRSPTENAARRSYNAGIASEIEQLILIKRDEITHRQPRVAIRTAIVCMSAMLREALVFGDTSLYPKPGDTAVVVRNVSDVMQRYLTA